MALSDRMVAEGMELLSIDVQVLSGQGVRSTLAVMCMLRLDGTSTWRCSAGAVPPAG